ncbi:thermonuclease family protein [Fictibacillus phosphorivorans]|uniref:thermonuclease family protein n=1 Tax=Fictibacillus phosphorivorans TaxID=1221500 RepID=UPI0020402154|nr:thermonuclease family protein [Fictibacillus phosphorivorans]MCM3718595.1 thermonuclease family protein [Fictibacillus phosphorivorans]MCM3776218.1 thermonuclease family protein [Fictibacillus phosphorivorans]
MKFNLRFWLTLSLVLLVLSACSQLQKSDNDRIPVRVIDVVDGDTIKVKVDGKKETVRFLLVDTPESVHPNKPVQPFSKEASSYVERMLSGSKVELELGIGERDKYGRLLAYVYADGKSVQEALLENGLARVAYVFEPNTKYVEDYEKIQKQAQKDGIGIWSLENYSQDDGYVPKESKNRSDKTADSKCTIKGNVNSSGEKIYHVESGRYYKITKPEEWFCTEQEAIEAGFRKSQQ